jgi:uncharacterized membrane protein
MRLLPLVIIAYPFVTHFSVVSHNPLPALGCLMIAAALLILRGSKRILLLFLATVAITGVTYALSQFPVSQQFAALHAPPILISLLFAWVFGRTLKPGRVPIVSRVAELYHKELSPELAQYTRQVTVAWTLFFIFLTLETLVLSLVSDLVVWSFFINFFNYILVACMVVGEYLVRIRRLPHVPHISFVNFLRLLSKADLRALGQG